MKKISNRIILLEILQILKEKGKDILDKMNDLNEEEQPFILIIDENEKYNGCKIIRKPKDMILKWGAKYCFEYKQIYASKFLGFQNPFFKKGFGGVKGQSPLRSLIPPVAARLPP